MQIKTPLACVAGAAAAFAVASEMSEETQVLTVLSLPPCPCVSLRPVGLL